LWDLDEFKVTWNTIANCSITVTRKSSQWSGAKIGALSSGDTIYYGDKLVVTYVANTGYHFEVNGSNPTSITNEFVVTKALTASEITAKPIINTYTVVYNGNGNSGGSMSSVIHTYGTAKNLTTNSFSRHGWTFTGWKDQNGKTYTNGQQVNDLTVKHGDTITLYAQWKILTSFTVNYSPTAVAWNGKEGASINLGEYVDLNSLKTLGYTKVTLVQEFTVTKTSNDKNAYVCSQVCFDAYDGVLWVNSPSDVTGGRRYTNIHYFTGGESVANLKWTNTRDLNGHTTIYFAFSSYNPWSIFNGYQCSYNISDHKVTIIFSK
jgi:uncharacterized repeat protein (TIGR02543 family)